MNVLKGRSAGLLPVSMLWRQSSRRGSAPTYIRCDNGPELTAEALKDWCRFNRTSISYIEPGAPWQNFRPPMAC
jgi:putative transposase